MLKSLNDPETRRIYDRLKVALKDEPITPNMIAALSTTLAMCAASVADTPLQATRLLMIAGAAAVRDVKESYEQLNDENESRYSHPGLN